MTKSLLKYKNYDVHAITTLGASGEINANIATWVMQSAMGGKMLAVGLYKIDYTIILVEQTGILNVNLLAQEQTNLIYKFGRKSGRGYNKFSRVPFSLDERGCPYLNDAIGFAQCQVVNSVDSGDHQLFVCQVIKQQVLKPDGIVLTNNYLRGNGLVRG